VLESGEIQRLGSPQPSISDVQVIAATSRDLNADTKSGRFRPDLWYRLSMVQIHLPPLRERGEDVLLLASQFLSYFSAQFGKEIARISRRAESALLAHPWPGNVRELLNVIGRAVMLTTNKVLELEDLPEEVRSPLVAARSLPTSLAEADKKTVITVLARAKSKAGAARQLGISRARLYRLMERYGLDQDRPSVQPEAGSPVATSGLGRSGSM
jgi:DNA-binding NtrC family response regulator